MAKPSSSIASARAAIPHGMSCGWLIYQTQTPNIDISLSTWTFYCCLEYFGNAGESRGLWGVAHTASELRTAL